ncbi:MAG: 4-hydroxyphenylpyruvate dioxygenase [Bdellovibrionota bacterium]
MSELNPIGLDGIEFIEFSSASAERLHELFTEFGFSKIMRHEKNSVDLYKQNDISFILNTQAGSFAESFQKTHGPSISSMGWRVKDAKKAYEEAIRRGAAAAKHVDFTRNGQDIPAIMGIGDSLIYFIDAYTDGLYPSMGFINHPNPVKVANKGFLSIDHLTNNVYEGTMKEWSDFYKNVFGFTEVRYFDIRGVKTGLTSYALKSPCGKFCIPINEGTEKRSQINEYLDEYRGPGVQHLAFLTGDIVSSLRQLDSKKVETLDIDDEYYDTVFERVPNVTEDHQVLREMDILVDGDDEGYLLQIFTKNVVGPIFIEVIQRKNHLSFGEGNFGALFRSIEKDQEKRGYI